MYQAELLLSELRNKYGEWLEMGVPFDIILATLLIKEKQKSQRIEQIYSIEKSGVCK